MCNTENYDLVSAAMEENGPEWSQAVVGLIRATDGATPSQIGEVLTFLEQKKTAEAEAARLREQIEAGREILKTNEELDLTLSDFIEANKLSDGDKFKLAEALFLVGVSIGYQIGESGAITGKRKRNQ